MLTSCKALIHYNVGRSKGSTRWLWLFIFISVQMDALTAAFLWEKFLSWGGARVGPPGSLAERMLATKEARVTQSAHLCSQSRQGWPLRMSTMLTPLGLLCPLVQLHRHWQSLVQESHCLKPK